MQTRFKFLHLCLVLNKDRLFSLLDIAHHTVAAHYFFRISAGVELCELFSQFGQLLLVLSEQRILGVLIDPGFILDVFGSSSVS